MAKTQEVEKARTDYTLAEVASAVGGGSMDAIARVAKHFPVLVAGLLKDPLGTVAAITADKKAVRYESRAREAFGLKGDMVEAQVEKEASTDVPEQPEPSDDPPGADPEPVVKPKPKARTAAPAPEPAKPALKGKDKPTKDDGKKQEDDLDALLNELEDAPASEAGAGDDAGEGDDPDTD